MTPNPEPTRRQPGSAPQADGPHRPGPPPWQRRLYRVTGTVQGVGFRPFVYREALSLGLAGSVRNDDRGVLVDAEGPLDALEKLAERLVHHAPPLARVDQVIVTALAPAMGQRDISAPDAGSASRHEPRGAPRRARAFRIDASTSTGTARVPVSVDIATCAACLAELRDPADRRYRYPFINCTDCGPRYTIVCSVPYDRPATTMASFTMCASCQAEYDDPADRRFHAQPNACWDCGPTVVLRQPDGHPVSSGIRAVDAAAALLVGGSVVALKGIGGYHLAVDATNPSALATLRRRKARDDKPFAVMVRSVEMAEGLVVLDDEARATLVSPRRPIVLTRRRTVDHSIPDEHEPPSTGTAQLTEAPLGAAGSGGVGPLADAVAPGLSELGLMLPYTPLHHLLLDMVDRPLVMTSGNLSDDPIAHLDDDAVARLGPMADAIVTHDRLIHIRCDDSVVRASPGRLQVLRRSRGLAPEPLTLPGDRPAARRVLAVGAELKNTVSVAWDRTIVPSHHIGDLEHLATYQAFLQALAHLCDIHDVAPDVVAHDLHPEYLSTKHARDLADEGTVTSWPVQHHHAHVAACMVDAGVTRSVLGVAFDGFGFGDDGTLWGGEWLVANFDGYQRVGHLAQVAVPGGRAAVAEPWRMALAWIAAGAGDAAAARWGAQVDTRWQAVLRLAHDPGVLRTTSAGRLFDAVAAIVGLHRQVTYEGQAAIALEASAAAGSSTSRRYHLDRYSELDSQGHAVTVLDPGPMVTAIAADADAGTSVAELAGAFHLSLADAVADTTASLAQVHHLDTVALSGGVFQNVVLSDALADRLRRRGLQVLVHRHVPPNDGGISVGQAAIAALGTPQTDR